MRAARSCGTQTWTSVSRSARPTAPPGAAARVRRIAEQGDDGHVPRMGGFDRRQHRGGLAARAQDQQHVAGLAQRADLAREAVGVECIGRVGGGVGGIAGQGDRGQLGTIALEAADELRRELRRQKAGDARAAREDLAAAGDAGEQRLHGLRDGFAEKRARPGISGRRCR